MPEQSILWATTVALQHGQMDKERILHLFVLEVTCKVDSQNTLKIPYYFKFLVVQVNNIFNYSLDPQYKVGALGSSNCPNGYNHIQSISECNAARNELSLSRWNGEDNNAPSRLPYCFIGRSLGANYNSNGNTGPNPSTSRLICENDRKYYSQS